MASAARHVLLLALALITLAPARGQLSVAAAAATKVTPLEGSWKLGATKLGNLRCPTGYRASSRDSDIVLARSLADEYFIQMARPELLKAGNTKYGCPKGAEFVDGDPFFPAAKALGESKHNSVSVCVPNKRPTAKGAKVFLYAQAVINYNCVNTPSRALHVGAIKVKGYYRVGGGSGPRPSPPPPTRLPPKTSVVPIRGDYKLDVAQVPPMTCPALNYVAATKDSDFMLARQLIDAYYVQMVRPELLKAGNNKYGCPQGADFVDGDPFFPAAKALGDSKHNSVSACMPKVRSTDKGSKVTFFAQGVINYHCKNTPSRELHSATLLVKGTYVV